MTEILFLVFFLFFLKISTYDSENISCHAQLGYKPNLYFKKKKIQK